MLFDIASEKKYRLLMRILKRYATRIQKSVFDAYLKPRQIREMTDSHMKRLEGERTSSYKMMEQSRGKTVAFKLQSVHYNSGSN